MSLSVCLFVCLSAFTILHSRCVCHFVLQIWEMSDIDQDGEMDSEEFAVV